MTSQHLQLRWRDIYSEPELYKAAIRLYTKPLFAWRKALIASTDDKTLYDFARRGLKNLDALHQALSRGRFEFRPGLALHYNFNGKHRTLYIYPWEERIVDLLLYRLLNKHLHSWFSPHAYAYRIGSGGVDACQRKIARTLSQNPQPLYAITRDITDYFGSVDHDLLKDQLTQVIEPDDVLFRLLSARIDFTYKLRGMDEVHTASRGIPFGTAIACFFANVYLTDLDHRMSRIEHLHYFRYADDLLAVSARREATLSAAAVLEVQLDRLRLQSNSRHQHNILFSHQRVTDPSFARADRFKHLGLEFRADGSIGLSRDKFRKICNLFRYGFRRSRGKILRSTAVETRARRAIEVVNNTLMRGVRNVAIIDYYLRHVNDERQLRLLDRWLAEEVLSIATGRGHKKGNFRLIPFEKLRAMGLPSLVHRRRLILHGYIESPFFIWQNYQRSKGSRGTAVTPARVPGFSPSPEAAVTNDLVGERDRL